MTETNLSETLKTSEEIVLFGRKVTDLTVKNSDDTPAAKKNIAARIYGFTFDGVYYEMLGPVLFVVEGPGVDADKVPVPGPNPRDEKYYESLMAWTVNKDEETIRLDVDTGKFQSVLLDTMGDGSGSVSGARVSGARVSGARVSGARVSGARVSGARVSGARISGDASD